MTTILSKWFFQLVLFKKKKSKLVLSEGQKLPTGDMKS
jgi:hypothetical protein